MGDEETSVGAPLAADAKAEEATAVEATEAHTSGRGITNKTITLHNARI